MKKKILAVIALLCVGVMLSTAAIPLGIQNTEDLVSAEKVAEATELADETVARVDAPSNDIPLPKNYEKWDGTVATGFAAGTGTKSDPFLISTPAEFAFFILACKQYSADVNGTVYYTANYKLTSDLVFNDDFDVTDGVLTEEVKETLQPFSGASYTTDFNGTFNGNGHILYNLYIPHEGNSGAASSGTGLFGQVGGTIVNLHIVRGYMTNGADNTQKPGGGTFARVLTGTIDSCSSGMTYVFRGSYAGGLVGMLQNESAAKSGTVSNCAFTGFLKVESSSGSRAGDGAGGIIGFFNGADGAGYTKRLILTDCVNRGTVWSTGKYIGGIIGKIGGSHGMKPEDFAIARCVNFGDVYSSYKIPSNEANPGRSLAGGIVGGASYMSESEALKNISYHFEYCANFGTVSAQESGVGGIIGGMVQQTNATAHPMCFYSCYSLGLVKNESPDGETNRYGGKWIGGVIGTPMGPVEIYDSIIGGEVRGREFVGGVIGRVCVDNAYKGAGKANLKLIATHVSASVSAVQSAGGVVGLYTCGGSKDSTTFQICGSYFDGFVTAENMVGGLIGSLEKGNGSTLINMEMKYSVMDVRLEKTTDQKRIGLLIGSTVSSCTPSLSQSEFYVANEAYTTESGSPEKITDARVMYGFISLLLDKSFVRENLTNGTYLNRLEFGSVMEASTIKWVASSVDADTDGTPDKKPIHENADKILTSPLGRSYDGLATELKHADWLGVTPICSWEKWDGTAWVTLAEAPRAVGTYRVKAALLSSRAAGAAVYEFEITRKLIDFATLVWSGDLAPVYTGHEYVVELAGVPAGITVTYTDSRKIDAGVYHAHLVSAVDDSGNYDIINTDQVTDQRWVISQAAIDMRNIIWSDIDAATGEPRLIYNEEEQSIRLIDKTDPERDLNALMNIVYTGERATEAGTAYSATATVTYNSRNVSVSYPRTEPFETDWEIARRTIRPWAEAELTGGTVVTGLYSGVSVEYDAREHILGYRENLPSCVEVEIRHVSADADGEDDGKYKKAGLYSYIVTFKLTDAENNVFALETSAGVFTETDETTIKGTRYLEIAKATPTIFGAISQDTTYISWDPEGILTDEAGNFYPDAPHPFAIGVQYNQDKTIRYDEEGNEISTLLVDREGTADFRAELAEISKLEYFSVRYYRLEEYEKDGEICVKEIPVTNHYGNEQELDGSWARPYNAGTYRAVVTYTAPENSNFTDATKTATLIINPAQYDLPLNIVLRDETIYADGDEHILRLQYEETLPSFIKPVYFCNESETVFPSTPGRYPFKVEFRFSEEMEGNYQPLKSMQAYLTILTRELLDDMSGVSMSFGEGIHWRLLVNERTDVDSFVTDWSVGFDTALKSLYQIELKEDLSNIWVLEEAATLRLPLTEEMGKLVKKDKKNLIPVFVSIDENGKFTMTEIKKYSTEMLSGPDDIPEYIEFDVNRIGYYGIVTTIDGSPEAQGRMIWLIVAACMVPPAVLLIVVSVKGRRKKNKNKDK